MGPHFSRRLNDWEMDLVERFFLGLQTWRVGSNKEDRLVWAREKSGTFSVKALYKVLEPGGPSNFYVAIIWNSWVPPKVSLFAWEATWGKVLTLDLLKRRGWLVATKCFLCHEEEKSVNITFSFTVTRLGLFDTYCFLCLACYGCFPL